MEDVRIVLPIMENQTKNDMKNNAETVIISGFEVYLAGQET